jgi:hypothetical protein
MTFDSLSLLMPSVYTHRHEKSNKSANYFLGLTTFNTANKYNKAEAL